MSTVVKINLANGKFDNDAHDYRINEKFTTLHNGENNTKKRENRRFCISKSKSRDFFQKSS